MSSLSLSRVFRHIAFSGYRHDFHEKNICSTFTISMDTHMSHVHQNYITNFTTTRQMPIIGRRHILICKLGLNPKFNRMDGNRPVDHMEPKEIINRIDKTSFLKAATHLATQNRFLKKGNNWTHLTPSS